MGLIYHRPLGEYFSIVVVDQTSSAAVLLNAAYRKILLPTPRLLADSERLMSVTGLLCGHLAGGIRRLQRTQAPRCLDLLPTPREVGRCSRIFLVRHGF